MANAIQDLFLRTKSVPAVMPVRVVLDYLSFSRSVILAVRLPIGY